MLPVRGVKIDGKFFPYQSDTKSWDDDDDGSMSHVIFFLTRMFHHLVEPFDNMNYHILFRQAATNTYLRPASTGVYVTPM